MHLTYTPSFAPQMPQFCGHECFLNVPELQTSLGLHILDLKLLLPKGKSNKLHNGCWHTTLYHTDSCWVLGCSDKDCSEAQQ